jgi:hypothetical protein
MKKLVLCLVLVLCLFGCEFDNTTDITIKNDTDIVQTIDVVSVKNDWVESFLINPCETVSKNIPRGYYKEIKTSSIFDRQFDFAFKNNIWSIVDAKRTTYTVINELECPVTLQNFEIIDNRKTSPFYSFPIFECVNGVPSTTSISVYNSWKKNIWDLEERIINNNSDYKNNLTQSIKIEDSICFYEIVITGNTIYIRHR